MKGIISQRRASVAAHANWWHDASAPRLTDEARFRFLIELLIRKGKMTRAEIGSEYREKS